MRKRQCSKPTFNMYVRRKNNEKYMKKIVGQKFIKKSARRSRAHEKSGFKRKNHQKTTTFFVDCGV